MEIVGRHFKAAEFAAYATPIIKNSAWKPQFVVLHNTGAPTLAERPAGLMIQHIVNLQHYYEGLGWHAGPHLFVDQNGIWVFSPLDAPGVHSPSWNAISYGVEQLGDYDIEAYDTGPGALVKANAVVALAVIQHAAGIDSDSMRLHKMDPLTTHKNCPGKNCAVEYDLIKREVHDWIVANLG